MESSISIIIPTYNRASALVNAINSVLAQDLERWELIIVDDGSNDETGKIIEPFLEDKRIRYYYQENKGVSVARNTGANFAGGEYVIFLDSDDTFFPNLLSTLSNNEFHQYDLTCWEVVRIIDGKVKIEGPVNLNGVYNNIKAIFLAGSICIKKEIFFQVGGYDPEITFSENYELGIRISQRDNLKIKLINVPLLKYEVYTSTRSSNSLENRLTSHLYQYEKHKALYNRHKKADAEMNYLIGYVLEKSNKKMAALKQYKKSWASHPLNFKALVKILLLKYT